MRALPLLLLLNLPTACKGDVVVGADYQLILEPVIAENQDPFEGVERFLLVVEPAVGEPESYPMDWADEGLELTGMGPITDATLVIEGYIGTDRVLFGRSERITADSGEIPVSILIAAVDDFAWAENLEEELHQAAVAPTGDGSFLVFGGSDRAPSISSASAVDSVLRIDVASPGDDLSLYEIGTLPTYTVEDVDYTGRSGHTATLLSGEGAGEGTILVAGGGEGFLQTTSATSNAFLFDPVNEEVLYEVEMLTPRLGHKAVQNKNGDILIIGGLETSDLYTLIPVAPIEYFSRDTGSFEDLGVSLEGGNSVMHLFGAAASMEEEGVLYCGGFELDDDDNDGNADWRALPDCIVISISGVVSEADPMPEAVIHHAFTSLPDGRVLMTGGIPTADWIYSQNETLDPTAGIYLYDPATGSWSDTGKDLRIPRHHHVALPLPDGRVLIAGGSAEPGDFIGTSLLTGLACAEVYDPSNNTLVLVDDCTDKEDVSSLPARMSDPAAAADPSYGVLLVGGLNESDAVNTAALWVGDPG